MTMSSATPWIKGQYPPARRSSHVDVYKSESKVEVNVCDPYRWLEENSEETEQWTTAQEAYTRTYLDQNPDRKKLEDEIRKNTDYAKV
jgi:prolyl oligopeptidase